MAIFTLLDKIYKISFVIRIGLTNSISKYLEAFMSIEAKKVTGFISIGLFLVGIGLCVLSIFVIPQDLMVLSLIMSLLGGYLATTGSLWPVFFSMPDEYGDQVKGFKRFLLLASTLLLFSITIIAFMFSIMKYSIGDSPLSIIGIVVTMSHIIFGIVALFFLEGNERKLTHDFFDFIPHETLLIALWVASPIVFPLCIISWFIGWGHTFFFKSLPLWKLIAFFVCLVSLVTGLIFYFRPMGESELDKDLKLIGVILFYVASLFPGVIMFGDDAWERNGFMWVGYTIIPMMIATYVASIFANIALFEGTQIGVANTITGAWCLGAVLGFMIILNNDIKFMKSWPIPVKIALISLLAPLWTLVAGVEVVIQEARKRN